MGGTTRDYLILQYRGSDRLYLPVEQIEAITPYSGGESPTLSKMGGADWQRTRARARAAAGEVAAELVELYRRRLAVEGHAFGPDTPWQARDGVVVRVRRDRGPAAGDRRRQGATWRSRDRWTAWCAATSGSARPRSRCAPSSRRCRTARRLRCWPRRRCWRASTPRRSPTATRPTRSGSSCSAGSSRRPSSGPSCRAWPTGASTWSSARTGCWPRTCSSRSSGSWWSTRSSASG